MSTLLSLSSANDRAYRELFYSTRVPQRPARAGERLIERAPSAPCGLQPLIAWKSSEMRSCKVDLCRAAFAIGAVIGCEANARYQGEAQEHEKVPGVIGIEPRELML